jgi:hypothetical protein
VHHAKAQSQIKTSFLGIDAPETLGYIPRDINQADTVAQGTETAQAGRHRQK